MLMLQVWSAWQMRFSLTCYERFLHFEDEFGVSAGIQQVGSITLVNESVVEQEQRLIALRRQLGIDTQILTPDDVKARLPLIETDKLAFGVYGAVDATLDTPTILQGYKTSAQRLSVQVYEGVRATGLTIQQGRIASVETTEGTISTRKIVNAAGADAGEVGTWAGFTIPIHNRVRNIFVVEHISQMKDNLAFVYDAEGEWYFRQMETGIMVGMGKRKDALVQSVPDMDYWSQVQATIQYRVPSLAQTKVIGGWSGIRPLTPDHRPILGGVETVEGFVNCCGWGGEGIMHSPVGGQLTAEFIHDGQTSLFTIEPFLLSRFN